MKRKMTNPAASEARMVTFTIEMPREMAVEARRQAKRAGMSRPDFLGKLLREWMAREGIREKMAA
jgi:hypothetical protein